MNKNLQIVLGLLRLSLGWIFFWAFLDKLFGLGFSTCRDAQTQVVNYFCKDAWLYGGSPTFGFLKFAVKGPFAEIFRSMAGNPVVDWFFMLGLLGVGLGLLLGIFMKLSTFFGGLMLVLIYLAGFLPPIHNPLTDEHIVYIIVMTLLCLSDSGNYLGLGNWWKKTKLVQKYKILK
ncbi:MAG: membrane protein [Candidatus Parcubacteria bacterium]|nr:MAG: membrane protein [Candidatus Parcubacteria bacterium]